MRSLRAALAALVLAVPSAASAEERILRYLSDVRIQRDSSIDVVETMDVRAENVRINHGIYRDFPTRYDGPHGGQVRVGFTFLGATLDGMPVAAKTEAARNGVRIKIGDPETYVPVGDHRYQIHYRTTRQIGRFRDFDELYWNATGNGWIFPIDLAEARIRLPAVVELSRPSAYTGPQGSTASNAEIVDQRPGDISFRTTRPLGPYEGLTVAVAFPKGVVAGPSGGSRLANWLADYGPVAAGGAALLLLAGFYYFAWQRAGRDPRAGTVVPIFAPPDGLTPAAMRYVQKMGSDNRTFAAALVDMGVRGHLRFVEEDGGWFVKDKTRLERVEGDDPLADEEQSALTTLLSPGESLLMEQKNHQKLSNAKKVLEANLKRKYEGSLFNKNWGWAIAGVLFFVGAMWLVAVTVVAAVGLDMTNIFVALGAALTTTLLLLWIQTATALGKCLATIVAFVFGALAFGTGAPILGEALQTGWWTPFLIPLLALPLVVSAFMWIDAPTLEGRKVLDRIAGFKQYLSITERERLDRMTGAPEDTPELFERYLPYAIALGVENRWADRFASVLAAAAAQGHQGFAWYSGGSSPWSNPGGFVNSVGSTLTSTISSASTAPGSSSGSGGGGFSGGGGGGGGGGGW